MTDPIRLILLSAIFSLLFLGGSLSFQHRMTLTNKRSFLGLKMSSDATQSSWDVSLRSPCKLNLFLRILGRRPTGFHDLASLFQAISFSDYMYFSKLPVEATCDEMTCSDSSLAVDGSNLVIKALNLMRTKTGKQQYFKVFLDKKVPMQAGLGGGSGNAATAMHAFNTLCGFPGTAYCTGRGEIVTPLAALPEWEDTTVHVFKPKEGLSTALVFKALDLGACSSVDSNTLLAAFKTQGGLQAAEKKFLVNDLEKPAFICNPDLLALKEEIVTQMGPGASGVMMSGSGTSIYALVRSNFPTDKVSTAVNEVLKAYPTVQHFKCEFLNKKDDIDSWY